MRQSPDLAPRAVRFRCIPVLCTLAACNFAVLQKESYAIKIHRLLAAILVAGLGLATAEAATVQPYQQGGFTAAQQAGKPILIFVEAPWCPTCAKERPILSGLYDTPEFKDLQMTGAAALAVAVLILSGTDRQLETAFVNASPAWLTDLTTRF